MNPASVFLAQFCNAAGAEAAKNPTDRTRHAVGVRPVTALGAKNGLKRPVKISLLPQPIPNLRFLLNGEREAGSTSVLLRNFIAQLANYEHPSLPSAPFPFYSPFNPCEPSALLKKMLTRHPVRDINYYKLTNDQKNQYKF
jgi:hypothetical protein